MKIDTIESHRKLKNEYDPQTAVLDLTFNDFVFRLLWGEISIKIILNILPKFLLSFKNLVYRYVKEHLGTDEYAWNFK